MWQLDPLGRSLWRGSGIARGRKRDRGVKAGCRVFITLCSASTGKFGGWAALPTCYCVLGRTADQHLHQEHRITSLLDAAQSTALSASSADAFRVKQKRQRHPLLFLISSHRETRAPAPCHFHSRLPAGSRPVGVHELPRTDHHAAVLRLPGLVLVGGCVLAEAKDTRLGTRVGDLRCYVRVYPGSAVCFLSTSSVRD